MQGPGRYLGVKLDGCGDRLDKEDEKGREVKMCNSCVGGSSHKIWNIR